MERLGMIGGGAMGSALLKGIVKQGLVKPEEIFLVEPDVTKRETLQTELGINIKNSPAELAAECPVMILAVKPGVIPGVLKELGSKADRSHLVISIAAGVTLASLSSELNKARLVRVMPNTPARISRGVTVYCLGPNTNPSDAEIVAAIRDAGFSHEAARITSVYYPSSDLYTPTGDKTPTAGDEGDEPNADDEGDV